MENSGTVNAPVNVGVEFEAAGVGSLKRAQDSPSNTLP